MSNFPGTTKTIGGFQYPSSGPNNAAEYMASGLPFVTSSTQSSTPYKISFPYVTSEIYIKVSGSSEVRVGFSEEGTQGSNYFVVGAENAGLPLRIRCKELYIMSHAGDNDGYSVMAAMTMIPSLHFPVLTGSVADPDTGMAKFDGTTAENIFGYNGI